MLASAVEEIDFAGYEVIARIAARPAQTVFLARRRGLGRFAKLCCLKTTRSEHLADDHDLDDFLREARIVTNLSHRHCVRVDEVGECDGVSFIAMEYVFGETFGELLQHARDEAEPIPVSIVVALLTAAAQGLHYAHELQDKSGESYGLVHRDVTPSNLMLSYEGVTKIIDFGAARIAQAVATRTGIIKGKTAYMAPEQLTGRTLDKRADIYSLGVILYEALSNERLYAGLTPPQIALRVYKDAPPVVERADISDALAAIVQRCLAREPSGRFEDAGVLASELLRLRRPLDETVGEEELKTYVRGRFPQRFESRQRILQECVLGDYSRDDLARILEVRPVLQLDLPQTSEAKDTLPPATDKTQLPTGPTSLKSERPDLDHPTFHETVKEQKTERVPPPESVDDIPTALQPQPDLHTPVGIEPGPTRVVRPEPLARSNSEGSDATASVEIESAPRSEHSVIARRRLQTLENKSAPSNSLPVLVGVAVGTILGVAITAAILWPT